MWLFVVLISFLGEKVGYSAFYALICNIFLDNTNILKIEMQHKVIDAKDVVIRFAGDSGDGMQLTGTRFSNLSAV